MTDDLAVLNSATKYPSIETYHGLDPANGRLVEDQAVTFEGPVILTEKIDGTNGRVIVMPDGDWFIGSREELLYARGDRIENPALGIVPALLALAPALEGSPAYMRVYFLEVYGHKIGGAAKQYTTAGRTGFRLFDIAEVPPETLEMPREQVSSWREHGGQHFLGEQEMEKLAAAHGGLPRAPRLGTVPGRGLPRSLEGMRKFLEGHAAGTRVALDEEAKGAAEGIVLRSANRGVIAKARFQDYDRTLRPLKDGEGFQAVTVRIAIDLNVNVNGNQTYSAIHDADGPVAVGDKVLAVEPETGIMTDAVVADVNEQFGFVYLEVDWQGFRDDPEAMEDPACE